MKRTVMALLIFVPAVVLAAGCEKAGPKRINVIGTVTFQGKNLTTGEVLFYPDDGGEPTRAVIGRDGTYRMNEMLTGHFKVAITTPPKPTNGRKASLRPSAPTPVYIPEKYSQPNTSGLEAEVPTTNKTIDFQLV